MSLIAVQISRDDDGLIKGFCLHAEPPLVIEDNRPPAYWPSNKGGIVFENLGIKYAPELDFVPRGINVEIKARRSFI